MSVAAGHTVLCSLSALQASGSGVGVIQRWYCRPRGGGQRRLCCLKDRVCAGMKINRRIVFSAMSTPETMSKASMSPARPQERLRGGENNCRDLSPPLASQPCLSPKPEPWLWQSGSNPDASGRNNPTWSCELVVLPCPDVATLLSSVLNALSSSQSVKLSVRALPPSSECEHRLSRSWGTDAHLPQQQPLLSKCP